MLNYYARNQRRPQRWRHRLVVVPLGIPKALEHIAAIENPQDTALFLDAFDEDTGAIRDHRKRLFELMAACHAFKRVLITCRTQFFPTAEEIPERTGIVRVGPRELGEGGGYAFWKLYLAPFNDVQVRTYLHRRYPYWPWGKRRRAQALVDQIPRLSVRPMLLANIPELLTSEATITHAFQLYAVLVERWLEREAGWVDKELLRTFSARLAVDLYVNREQRGAAHIPHLELTPLAAAWGLPELHEWQLRGRSLLNRDALGNYKFAHRSIMEYLVVTRAIQGDAACRGIPLTDQMHEFLRGAELRGAHLAGLDFQGVNLAGADLAGADLRGADLRRTIGLTSGQIVSAIIDEHTQLPEDCIEFVRIPAGQFRMGSTAGGDNERPVHTVTISQPFYLGKYPMTQVQSVFCPSGGSPKGACPLWTRGARSTLELAMVPPGLGPRSCIEKDLGELRV